MAHARKEHYEDNNVDFEAFDDYMDDDSESELAFEKIPSKKHQKLKQKREARRRLDDYFERKAFEENDWDCFDFEDEIYH